MESGPTGLIAEHAFWLYCAALWRSVIIPGMSHEDETLDSRSPRAGGVLVVKVAIVRCRDFRCMGYLGHDKQWRNEHGQILDVVEVVTELP